MHPHPVHLLQRLSDPLQLIACFDQLAATAYCLHQGPATPRAMRAAVNLQLALLHGFFDEPSAWFWLLHRASSQALGLTTGQSDSDLLTRLRPPSFEVPRSDLVLIGIPDTFESDTMQSPRGRAAAMSCTHCQGLMLKEDMIDMKAASILIIDDDLLMRSLCKEILEQAGYHVIVACNGHEGLQLFRQTSIDLVITDVFMPERDGLEVIMTLHREKPTIPIIAFTGNAVGRDFLTAAKYLGAQYTIAKPFAATDLTEAVYQQLHILS